VKRYAVILFVLAAAARADVMPTSSNEDSRIGIVRVSRQEIIRLQSAPGTDLTLLFPRGEHIQQVTLADPNVWHASVTGEQDAMVLSPLRSADAVAMTVRTDRRGYEFALTASARGINPYLIRMESQDVASNAFKPKPGSIPGVGGTYKLFGRRELYPSSVHDDGHKMYLEWDASQPIPAIFSRDALGREQMVDGYMRDGIFTLDRLYSELVFRIDKAEAHALLVTRKAKS